MLIIYSILLVDDEKNVANSIKDIIDWKKYGFLEPVYSENGKIAINLLEEGFLPDVVITDICMPLVDGIELTTYITQKQLDTKVVILSGYDDFSYAQQAIKLNVFDYILKPITPKELEVLLVSIKKSLDETKFSKQDTETIKLHFLNNLLSKKLDKYIVEQSIEEYKLNLIYDDYIVLNFDIDKTQENEKLDTKEIELMQYGLFNIISELTIQNNIVTPVRMKDGTTSLIVCILKKDTYRNYISALCNKIIKIFYNTMNMYISVGIGKIVSCETDLNISYKYACEALEYRFFTGNASITFFEDINIETHENILTWNLHTKIANEILSFNKKKALEHINELVIKLKDKKVSVKTIFIYTNMLVLLISQKVEQYTNNKDIHLLDYDDIVNDGFFHIEELKEFLVKVLDNCFEIFDSLKNDNTSEQIIKAEKYIRDNFSNSALTLNTVTEYVQISTSYFSTIFKTKTGMTFIEYLTRERIENAKKMLALSDKRGYEIAYEVGFSDAHYFSVVFKRVTGMTPKEYREKINEEEVIL